MAANFDSVRLRRRVVCLVGQWGGGRWEEAVRAGEAVLRRELSPAYRLAAESRMAKAQAGNDHRLPAPGLTPLEEDLAV